MSTPKIKPCPWCGPVVPGADDYSPQHECVESLTGYDHYMRCPMCLATGPKRQTKREAIVKWNTLATETKGRKP